MGAGNNRLSVDLDQLEFAANEAALERLSCCGDEMVRENEVTAGPALPTHVEHAMNRIRVAGHLARRRPASRPNKVIGMRMMMMVIGMRMMLTSLLRILTLKSSLVSSRRYYGF